MDVKEARINWRKMELQINEMRWLALQMLSHPDTTPEQLADVHRAMVHTMTEYRRMRKLSEEKKFFTSFFQPDRRLK